ncbi:hypothetical protein BJ508DRAFT_414541 [Ascobolus immersus RN42]|uniref:RAD52 homolog n=1 Tax=Ascobolus immersus RN42 TaxID=1160509 RepID=A0A3N4ICE9_ASCIM|nr:hypothetical protein BJ508DRAFT_414541 [Ascobolus immersus RN42]
MAFNTYSDNGNFKFPDTVQKQLQLRLGPQHISSRIGPNGQKLHYLSTEKSITLANEIFGFNGWSSSIANTQVDFVDIHPESGKVSIGLSVVLRVTLRDGTFHEDVGYGHIENCKGKALAFEKAKKEATSDALKRALRHFGNALGNCLYDKSYLSEISKNASKHQTKNAADFYSPLTLEGVEIKETSSIPGPDKGAIDDVGMAELEKMGFFDSGDLEEFSVGNPNTPDDDVQTNIELPRPIVPSKRRSSDIGSNAPSNTRNVASKSRASQSVTTIDRHPSSVGFYSAKSAELLQRNEIPKTELVKFDPRSGLSGSSGAVDYTKSAPVLRNTIESSRIKRSK